MPIVDTIKSHPDLKKLVHRMLIPKGEARPRAWVKIFVNRFFHTRGKGSVVREHTRMDVFPFNHFHLGASSIIEDFSCINNGVGDVTIGDNSLVGMGNAITGPVAIGNNVIMAQNIVVSGLNHDYWDVDVPIHRQKVTTATINIEDDCWIAANVVVTAGVTIGRHCVIAAGSVVTKNVPPYSVAAGNPAKVIKHFDAELNKWVKVGSMMVAPL